MRPQWQGSGDILTGKQVSLANKDRPVQGLLRVLSDTLNFPQENMKEYQGGDKRWGKQDGGPEKENGRLAGCSAGSPVKNGEASAA